MLILISIIIIGLIGLMIFFKERYYENKRLNELLEDWDEENDKIGQIFKRKINK